MPYLINFTSCKLKVLISKSPGFNNYKDTFQKYNPFAFDPSGNLICFVYTNHEDNPIEFVWEHENAAEKEILREEEGLTEEQAEERSIKDYKNTFFNEYPDLKGSVLFIMI